MSDVLKPKLVFFRYIREGLPRYILLHLDEHVRCLSQFFDVTVVSYNCDYAEICEKYKPQVTLFESGVYVGERHITNTSAHPEVPKLGFLNCDAYCETREVFISDMARWNVQTFFTLSVSMGEYTPEISKRLFAWPNFADSEVYRDYGLFKAIPILLTGSRKGHYPWRNRLGQELAQHYPSLTTPHFGWFNEGETARMSYGEEYARMINASWFAPTCGTMAKELVRKHFEIPASRACLITEKTAATEAAGFRDQENCVYADEHDVLDKVEYLFQRRDELERITTAGWQLVHARHTMNRRDQIFQWFNLSKNLQPGQRIVQLDPFRPMVVVDEASPIHNGHFIGPGLDRILLREGDERLSAGKYDEAEKLYLKCLNYQSSIPEAKLRLALANLHKGNSKQAIYWVSQPLRRTLEVYRAAEPDPVEWAYFIVALLCDGKCKEALKRADQFPSLRHVELDRARVLASLLGGSTIRHTQSGFTTEFRSSLHVLPERGFEAWAENICGLLRACRQSDLAMALNAAMSSRAASSPRQKTHPTISETILQQPLPTEVSAASGSAIARENMSGMLPLRPETLFEIVRRRSKPLFKKLVVDPLRELELRFGYFLPYRFSAMKTDEFLSAVRRLVKDADIKTGAVVGATRGEGSTEAFLAGMRENPNCPVVYCLGQSPARISRLQKLPHNESFVICDATLTPDGTPGSFGAMLIRGSELDGAASVVDKYRARYVFLSDINALPGHQIYQLLVGDAGYHLVACNPEHGSGYAIFEATSDRLPSKVAPTVTV